MNIKDNRMKDLVRFGELFSGDCFFAAGDVAMKTADNRAYILCNGAPVHRDDQDLVERADCEVIIN